MPVVTFKKVILQLFLAIIKLPRNLTSVNDPKGAARVLEKNPI